MFDRLDTTPEQERAIRAELDSVYERAGDLRRAWRRSRGDLAQVMRGESFDETAMAGVLSTHDEAHGALRETLVGAIARIHNTLNPAQRERLADMLESGLGNGPYRGFM
jgi:uncharacterized membrane protein